VGFELAQSQIFSRVVEQVSPSVVSLEAVRVESEPRPTFSDPFATLSEGEVFRPQRRVATVGSGVLMGAEGYILTNHHVINGMREVRVLLADDRTSAARCIGSDPASDLAVLRIDLPNLPSAVWGSSQDLKLGEFVLAFGSPYRMKGSVSHGIVSGKGRKDMGIADTEDFIQTDAAINPGNSGGPLCNLQGQVVGINTAMLSRTGGSQGIGLAIPSDLARSVFEELVAKGRVDRAWLGVWIEPLTADLVRDLHLPQKRGVLVQGGYRFGPAGKAGIQAGDVFLEIQDQSVDDVRAFRSILAGLKIDEPVDCQVWRRGQLLKLKIRPEIRALDKRGHPARGL